MISKPYSTDFTLNGKTAVITGAGSGIGYATAKLFAEKGATVCLLDRNLESVQHASESIPNSHSYFIDVADYTGVNKTVDLICQEVGNIDILVHCAGIGDIEWAKDFDEKTWNKVINVNLNGTFFMAQAVGKKMRLETVGRPRMLVAAGKDKDALSVMKTVITAMYDAAEKNSGEKNA